MGPVFTSSYFHSRECKTLACVSQIVDGNVLGLFCFCSQWCSTKPGVTVGSNQKERPGGGCVSLSIYIYIYIHSYIYIYILFLFDILVYFSEP